MALPASGNSISLDQIHVELGESSGTTVALGDDDVRGLASDTSGAIGMDQFFGLSSASNIEDVYSTFVYKGDGSTRNIVNGLNFSGDGGLVWIKNRQTSDHHVLVDTARGVGKVLRSDDEPPETTDADTVTAFNSNGFSLGADVKVNTNNEDYVAWAWKKQAGFFDVVTYSGNETARTISHNLGAVPGMIIVKKYEQGRGDEGWYIWHRGLDESPRKYLQLRNNQVVQSSTSFWGNSDPTDSVFSVGATDKTNGNAADYIAYLFGHQANDDDAALISCGTYTGNGVSLSDSSAFKSVDVGFEPQFIMIKGEDVEGSWVVLDKIRGMATYKQNGSEELNWDTTGDLDDGVIAGPTATGFDLMTNNAKCNENNKKYVYMAIRNGPMAEPTAGSEVLSIDTIGSAAPYFDSAHPVDMVFQHRTGSKFVFARKLHTGEFTIGNTIGTGSTSDSEFDFMDGWGSGSFGSGSIAFMFHERVKAFTTQVYRGTGSNRTVPHKLGATPELLIIKNFTQNGDNWAVYYGDNTDHLHFNTVGGTADTSVTGEASFWNNTSPTSSVFTVGTNHGVNASNEFYFAFMFATVAGVTKVGTVNVTGATDVDCGFSSGSKFVMIKRYSGNGHWLVFDTTSGLVAGNDSYRKMEHTSDVVTNEDVIDPLNAGFSLTAAFLNLTNNGSGDYVFVAIAA